jgi:hypothetical protein
MNQPFAAIASMSGASAGSPHQPPDHNHRARCAPDPPWDLIETGSPVLTSVRKRCIEIMIKLAREIIGNIEQRLLRVSVARQQRTKQN